jgi:hypothetical protein
MRRSLAAGTAWKLGWRRLLPLEPRQGLITRPLWSELERFQGGSHVDHDLIGRIVT